MGKSVHTVATAAYSCVIHSIHQMLSSGYNKKGYSFFLVPVSFLIYIIIYDGADVIKVIEK